MRSCCARERGWCVCSVWIGAQRRRFPRSAARWVHPNAPADERSRRLRFGNMCRRSKDSPQAQFIPSSVLASPRRQHGFHFKPPHLLLAASLFALPPNTQERRWSMHTMDRRDASGRGFSRVGFLNQVPSARDRDPRVVSKAWTVGGSPARGPGSCSVPNERDACMSKCHCRPIRRRRRLRLNTDADGPNLRAPYDSWPRLKSQQRDQIFFVQLQ